MKKTIGLIILLILMLIMLTGCAQLNYEVEINKDGSGEISYVFGLSKNINSLVSSEDAIEEFREQAQEENYQVEAYEDENISGFKASKHIKSLNEEFSLQEAFPDYVTDTEENGIKVEKKLFKNKYSQTAELDLSKVATNYITMTYQIKLPTKVLQTNANEISEDGKTLKWNLTSGEVNKIEFTAEEINILPIILIIVVVVVAVVALIIILKKKHVANKNK